MKLYQCLNPQRVYNKHIGEHIYVPCGHCDSCRRSHNSIWIQRLEQEQQCWPYCAFVTLTYSDDNILSFSYDVDSNCLIDTFSGLSFSCDEIKNFNYKDKLFLHRKRDIYYIDKTDIQKFVKRLRYYFSELVNNPYNIKKYGKESSTLRYFIVSEYGPTTFRPHLHCLFFFSSRSAAENFSVLLSKSWKFGISDWSFVAGQDKASRYVAQYVNCSSNLPKIYTHASLKPFCLCSKHPAIGTLHVNEEEISTIFHSASYTRDIFVRSSCKYVTIPLWRSLQDKLFPRIKGFSFLSHYERVALYGISKFVGAVSFSDFKAWCFGFLGEDSQILNTPSCTSLFYIASLISDGSRLGSDYPLARLWLISRRVCLQAEIFGVTIDYYVSRIEEYYSNRDYYRLCKWLEFQQDYCKSNDCIDILLNDDDYLQRFTSRLSPDGSPSLIDNLIFEGFSSLASFYVSFDKKEYLASSFSFQSFKAELDYFVHKSTKTKRKNEYLSLHPELNFL